MGSKLDPRSELCYFVGYPKGTRGGYFYHPQEHKVFVSTNARYLEDDQSINTKCSSKVDLGEKDSILDSSSVPTEIENEIQHQSPPQILPRRSGRVTKVLERWTGEVLDLISDHQEVDPTSYDE